MIYNLLVSILMGVVEGITEWLPISSTGHMILVEQFLPLTLGDSFAEMYRVVVQLGAIIAVVILFFPKLWPFQSPKKTGSILKMDIVTMWLKVIVASIPAALLIPIEDKMDELFYNAPVVAAMLIVYGIAFIWLEKRKQPRHRQLVHTADEMSYKMAFFIGCFQALAVIPGTSRSGATILGAALLGAARPWAAEFSFFMAIPAMAGASLLKLVKFLVNGTGFTAMEGITLFAGMLTAFVVSIIVIRVFMDYIKRKDFTAFGWYRIILGALVAVYFLWIK